MLRLILIMAGLAVVGPALADEASALKAVQRVRGVIDAQADGKGNLFVAVRNDRSQTWSQFAGQLCEVVKPHRARIFRVRVLDVTAIGPSKPIAAVDPIGQASCAK